MYIYSSMLLMVADTIESVELKIRSGKIPQVFSRL